MKIIRSKHVTPKLSGGEYQRKTAQLLFDFYGCQIRTCGYCGSPSHKSYVCDCGYQLTYADDRDEDGNLVEVWSKTHGD